MGVLIDASLIIAAERRGDPSATIPAAMRDATYLSVITVSELLNGVHRTADPRRRGRRSEFVNTVLATWPILPVNERDAHTHAELRAELDRR